MDAKSKKIVVAAFLGAILGVTITTIVNDMNGENALVAGSTYSASTENTMPQAITNSELKNQPSTGLNKFSESQILSNKKKIRLIERRMRELDATIMSDELSAEAASEVEEKATELDEMTPEEAQAQDLEWWRNTRAVYEEESIDPKWAEPTNEHFVSDISQLAEEKGFSLIHTECRTTQCEVVLEWPSYGEASAGFTHLLHHEYKANCARYTLLPEPDDAENDQPYEMSVIFDCSAMRDEV